MLFFISIFLAFTDTGRLISDAAKNQVAMNPTNTAFDAKRLIGRRFDDPNVQADMINLSFNVINDSGQPKIKVCAFAFVYHDCNFY